MASFLSGLTKRRKSPQQLTSLALQGLHGLTQSRQEGGDEDQRAKARTQLAKRMHQMKVVLYGDEENEVEEGRCVDLARALMGVDGGSSGSSQDAPIVQLVAYIENLPFEVRKDLSQIYNALVRRELAGFPDFVEAHQGQLIDNLVMYYHKPDLALVCGAMLRENIRIPALNVLMLKSNLLWGFFLDYVHQPIFDVATDAFATLRDLLTKNKPVASQFLLDNYEKVFEEHYKVLLQSNNYVTRRQSLKLLGELLLDRANFDIMMRYIGSRENLKVIMNLLRDTSANIQFEAFHVFKVFVANPKKPPEIVRILVTNKTKLVAYLENFHTEREDNQFAEEKQLLITTLASLEMPPASEATPASEAST